MAFNITFDAGSGTCNGMRIYSINSENGYFKFPYATPHYLFNKYQFIGWTTESYAESDYAPSTIYEANTSLTAIDDITFYAVYCYKQDNWQLVSDCNDVEEGEYMILHRDGPTYTKFHKLNRLDSEQIEGAGYDSNGKINQVLWSQGKVEFDADGQPHVETMWTMHLTGTLSTFTFRKISKLCYTVSYELDGKRIYLENYHNGYADDIRFIRRDPEDEVTNGWKIYDPFNGAHTHYKNSGEGTNITMQWTGSQSRMYLGVSAYDMRWTTPACNGSNVCDYVGGLFLVRKPFAKYVHKPGGFSNPHTVNARLFIANTKTKLNNGTDNNDQEWTYVEDTLGAYSTIHGEGIYDDNSAYTVTFNIQHLSNYDISACYVNGESHSYETDNSTSITISGSQLSSDTIIEVRIRKKVFEFYLKVEEGCEGMGTVNYTSASISYGTPGNSYKCKAYWGESVSINGTPKNGNNLLKWNVYDDNGIIQASSSRPTHDHNGWTYKAVFVHLSKVRVMKQVQNNVTPGSVSINGSGTELLAESGQTFTITATPRPGFHFAYWAQFDPRYYAYMPIDQSTLLSGQHVYDNTITCTVPGINMSYVAVIDKKIIDKVQTDKYKPGYNPGVNTPSQTRQPRTTEYTILFEYGNTAAYLDCSMKLYYRKNVKLANTYMWDGWGNRFEVKPSIK